MIQAKQGPMTYAEQHCKVAEGIAEERRANGERSDDRWGAEVRASHHHVLTRTRKSIETVAKPEPGRSSTTN